ncbi:melanoma-associated antigen G1 [Chlorella sorokiniana]|uniref:Melanoma-associated antigen G1 n=1 Tax=Chlorella sorokiniana TaxID=3076 RepID=A0A2P6TNL4_CHLSO|nr:melanoma-associated antigen G1 [Chlorella sorokiniana]|eukprot:PRW50930.1 melanoma-associated antigen G1 [Chlorella sorokiniana]
MARPRRSAAARSALRQEEEEEQLREVLGSEDEEEEEPVPRRGRRAGKAPVEEDEEDYDPEADEGAAEEEQLQQEQLASGRRRGRAGGDADDEAGPSKRGRRGAAAVKQEYAGDQAGPSRRRGGGGGGAAAAAAAAAGGDGGAGAAAADGPPRATAGELRAVDEKITEYRRVRDHDAEKAQGKVSRPALEQASRAVVRHMLFAHSDKPGVPVRRSEIAAVISARFPNVKAKAAVSNYVIAHAAHYLVESMGLEMASVPKLVAKARAGEGAEEGGQQYVLRSIVPPALRAAYVLSSDQSAERGLLMVVLALIQLAGGKLAEDELWAQLGELGIDREAPHPAFGRTAEQLKTFCTRRYIQVSKAQGPEGEAVTYHFAEQAAGDHAEISQAAITRFIEEQFAGSN